MSKQNPNIDGYNVILISLILIAIAFLIGNKIGFGSLIILAVFTLIGKFASKNQVQ